MFYLCCLQTHTARWC